MFRQYRELEKDEFIVVGVDTASGLGDYVAGQFLSVTKKDVPLVYHSKETMTSFTPLLATVLEKISDVTGKKPVVAPERNAGGTFEIDRLAAMNRLNKFELFRGHTPAKAESSESIYYGWSTNTATRPAMLQDLKEAIDNQLLYVYDRATINEMFSFIIVQTTSIWKAQAEKGAHDDLIMALAIAWQLAQSVPTPITKEDVRRYLDELPEEHLFEGGFY